MTLKDFMGATNQSTKDMARALGVTPPTVWRWLAGTRHPNREQMLAIHRVTKGAVTPNDLVLG